MSDQRKSILVTGASTGIGYHCAKALAKDGWQVIASCRQSSDVSRLQSEGLTCVQLDVASTDSIHSALEKTLALTDGKLDALFNNGAYGQPGAVEDLTRDTLRKQFETNFFGWCELTNEVIKVMHKQGHGRIVHNSSVLGFAAMPFRGAYNASKFALEGITDTLRLELADTDIKVSLIEPGPILSDFRKNALKALEANVDFNNSRHGFKYAAAINRLSKPGPASKFTLGPDAVYKKLHHALTSKRPKPRYYVTFPTYLMGYLKRILTTRMMDNILGRIST
ncbi:SDR family oxidoreductase [Gilvimarinus xylanilyticus]|uniref:SDR family oxidoreductase n=1 Tax=Gilvimarinus xylanilyticus TaxID=2944139 RepID=A0A9X2HWL9_9GAMM|nr:SDR family oxidoreductase [Gilvimarinus xylanilyticus]MCP8898374.1 SDR family oxidoreductase [Gilvimarinus xylanilyticus]